MMYPLKEAGWKDKIAVITGASSGIGAATARKFAAHGMHVILIARRHDRLEAVAGEIRNSGGSASVMDADLTSEVERESIYSQIEAQFGKVDVLVNNAGVGWYGYGSEMPWKIASDILDVNIKAVAHFTLLFLKKMRSLGSGHIINVGSISGSLPSQGVAIYGSTKSFLDNFTTALYRELVGTRLHVSVVRAGSVRTEFNSSAASLDHGYHIPTERIGVTAETVANRIWGLLNHPRRVIYVPSWLAITPLVEQSFGWIIDRLGPLLLQREKRRR